jgi:hypothetical protein
VPAGTKSGRTYELLFANDKKSKKNVNLIYSLKSKKKKLMCNNSNQVAMSHSGTEKTPLPIGFCWLIFFWSCHL